MPPTPRLRSPTRPLNLIPIFDWVTANATYNAAYTWVRGSDLEDGTSLGNTVTTNRNININSTFAMERLYNHIPFLKKANDRFKKSAARPQQRPKKTIKTTKDDKNSKDAKNKKDQKANQQKKALPKNQRSFEKEIILKPDTTITVNHGKKTKRIIVSAKTEDGKSYKLKFRKKDLNSIRITNKVDSALKLKVTVTPKPELDNQKWYRTLQSAARFLMMIRNVSLSYRNQYSMALPGFMPMVGNAFGQKRNGGYLSPGLDFAMGMVGDSYIDRASERGWLLFSDSVATPATTSMTEDLQLRMTLEPVRDLKIDLNAVRTTTKGKSIQYMYQGSPTTESGTFTMTTLSLKSAFEGIGNANNGYRSKSFEKFVGSLDAFRDRVEARYAGTVYPSGTNLAGKTFDPQNGSVDKYSADVMIPAFLSSYTSMGGNSLDIFPTLNRILPNWTLRYSGLARLPWFRDHFKSFNINHGYKSIFAIGSYSSYSTFMSLMQGGDHGFIIDATSGNPIPSSMYNVSNVSINESFAPLIGLDMTFWNNLTAKLEYRTTRVLNLSMTSVQITENTSHDLVLGMGYKINNFNLFEPRSRRAVKSKSNNKGNKNQQSQTSQRNRSQVNHDLNLRLDMSYRKQANISRDIATMTSSASSGNTAWKISFMADYTWSRLLTLSFYYDRQQNTPLLSSNSYPTTTQDFGLSIKFSLTR